jgi:hypothetical protein
MTMKNPSPITIEAIVKITEEIGKFIEEGNAFRFTNVIARDLPAELAEFASEFLFGGDLRSGEEFADDFGRAVRASNFRNEGHEEIANFLIGNAANAMKAAGLFGS